MHGSMNSNVSYLPVIVYSLITCKKWINITYHSLKSSISEAYMYLFLFIHGLFNSAVSGSYYVICSVHNYPFLPCLP